MDKYGVECRGKHAPVAPGTKEASEGCPLCGSPLPLIKEAHTSGTSSSSPKTFEPDSKDSKTKR